jgi:hypothetical protein
VAARRLVDGVVGQGPGLAARHQRLDRCAGRAERGSRAALPRGGGGGDAAELAHHRPGQPAGAELGGELGQRLEGQGDAHALARGARLVAEERAEVVGEAGVAAVAVCGGVHAEGDPVGLLGLGASAVGGDAGEVVVDGIRSHD